MSVLLALDAEFVPLYVHVVVLGRRTNDVRRGTLDRARRTTIDRAGVRMISVGPIVRRIACDELVNDDTQRPVVG